MEPRSLADAHSLLLPSLRSAQSATTSFLFFFLKERDDINIIEYILFNEKDEQSESILKRKKSMIKTEGSSFSLYYSSLIVIFYIIANLIIISSISFQRNIFFRFTQEKFIILINFPIFLSMK